MSWLPVVVLTMVLMSSCRGRKASAPIDRSQYVAVDSLLRDVDQVDELAAVAERYHKGGNAVGELMALKKKGFLLRNDSRTSDAIATHNRCYEIACSLSDTIEMIMAYSDLGTDFRRMGSFSEANGYYYKALKLSDEFSDHESAAAINARSSALNGIGNIEIKLCNYATADSVLREALAGEQKLGRYLGMAVNSANLGSAMRFKGEIDSAWFYFRKSMEYNQLAGNEKGIALCHMHYGELHEDERKFSHAIEEYEEAYERLKATGDSWHWLESCLSLARVSILLGEEADAARYLQEAEAEALRIGSKTHQLQASMIHYDLSLLRGDTQDALKYYIRGNALEDSIYGLSKNGVIRSQRIEYERGRSSGEVSVLNRDITRLKRMRIWQVVMLSLLSLLSVGLIAMLFYAMRVRKRTQRLMRQVEETRSLFFTNVVHQLRTPLTVIMGAIDDIIASSKDGRKEADKEASLKHAARIVEHQGNNLLLLVDRILEVGSVRSALKGPDWRTGDVVSFMRMIVESYRESCIDRHIELNYAPKESSAQVAVVPAYLNTIVGSLIENAIAYSREFGKITVTSRVDNDRLVVRVADNGMGISKTDLPHVFEPFYRGTAAEQLVDGVGIGLTVVRDMVMAMGGTVAVDSRLECGSVFTVSIPCNHHDGMSQPLEMLVAPVRKIVRRNHDHAVAAAPTAATIADGEQCDRPVILVIEDHYDVAQLIGDKLGDGYVVHYASDGELGFAKANDLKPDLIITDVKMPLMDGLELCRRIRASRRLRHIPIIVLSARNSVQDRINGIEAGADVYMEKPFKADEMRMWVVKLLEMRCMLRETYSAVPGDDAMAAVVEDEDSLAEDDRQFLETFVRLADEQLSQGVTKLNIDKIALAFKMGESQFKRKVQALTGKNVVAYVAQLRMEKAMRLLRSQPDVLIGDVAEQCGFADVAYFSRAFRQYHGMTPTQARNGGSSSNQ